MRRLSVTFEVSIATVVEAYRRLEAQGVLEARPQSGYYVRARQWQAPVQPSISTPPCTPVNVNVSALAMKLLKGSRDPQVLKLAVATPHPDLLPVQPLNRILARLARNDDGSGCLYDFPPASPPLRAQIARRALDAGMTLALDDIVTTSGCQEALSLSLRAVAGPGDTIAIESPAFYGTLQTIERLGMKRSTISTGSGSSRVACPSRCWRIAASTR